MTITNNNNGHAVTLKSESTDNHTKLDELVNFLDTVKTQSGIGPFMFISEPARIRAKYDENENLILEARTGTIFGILYKKLTSNFPRAIKERDNARKYIIDILENLNVDKNSIYFTLINSELNKKNPKYHINQPRYWRASVCLCVCERERARERGR